MSDFAALLPADYPQFLTRLKTQIREAQVRAALAVNAELITLYWAIGHEILQRQSQAGWGLKSLTSWPPTYGMSSRNLPGILCVTSSI